MRFLMLAAVPLLAGCVSDAGGYSYLPASAYEPVVYATPVAAPPPPSWMQPTVVQMRGPQTPLGQFLADYQASRRY